MLSDRYLSVFLSAGWSYAIGPLSVRLSVCRPVLSLCLSVLSVTLVYCGQTVGQIMMKLGTQVGFGPGHIVLDGDPAPPPQRGAEPRSQFLAHFYCGQTADVSRCHSV